MSKYVMIVAIVGFWLFYPLAMMFMDAGNFTLIEDKSTNIEQPNAFNFLGVSLTLIIQYFQILVIGIPSAPLIITTIMFAFKMVSILVIYSLIRLG